MRCRSRWGLDRSTLRLAAGIVVSLLLAAPATATVITVTGTGDTIAPDGFVTLREAITAANINAAVGDAPAGSAISIDIIGFNIAGPPGTVHTIAPMSALPAITGQVFIDGYSQLGSTQNTLADGDNAFLAIELDGANAGFTAGLTISAGNSTVQGLVINRFANEGILVVGGGNFIRGNFLGTDQTGTLDAGNGIVGVALLSSNNVVGGSAYSHRNIISGNEFGGVAIVNAGTTGNRVEGNFIGTDDTGAQPLPNSGAGVRVFDDFGNTIGGTAPGAGNLIAFNTGAGVLIGSNAGSGNAILANSIRDNGGLGIDLGADGVTPNDPALALDGDSGPNGLQNFPVLTGALSDGTATAVNGLLQSAASTTYRVEFFASPSCDHTGESEGAVFLGAQDVVTQSDGAAAVFFQIPVALEPGFMVTATATDPGASTSELSACVMVAERLPGQNVKVRHGSFTKFATKPVKGDTFALPVGDPFITGGQLRVFDMAGSAGDETYPLPAGGTAPYGWKGLGTPAGSKGWKYKGTGLVNDPCKVVTVKSNGIKATCKGPGITLQPPFLGDVGIDLSLGTAGRYCARFGGVEQQNDATMTKRKNAPAPAACP